jgi:peptidoglycan/LPS O-acetylase OafA/YrhL
MKQQIRALTSLRFFAAGLIVVDHATVEGLGRILDVPFYQGVTFFFVLSGFILTYSYPSLPTWADIRGFWLARFARIWPGYMVAMIATLLVVPGAAAGYLNAEGLLRIGLAVLGLQAWVPVWDYYFAVGGVFWTISAEAFFYACFPLLLWRLDRTWPLKLLICFGLGVAICLLVGHLGLPTYARTGRELDAGGLIYTFPLTRLLEFMIGMSAAAIFRQGRWRIGTGRVATLTEIGILALIAAQFSLGPYWYEWGSPLPRFLNNAGCLWLERSGSAPLYAALIVIFAQERGWVARALRGRVWVLGGEISFSLYLIHQTLLRLMHAYPDLVLRVPSPARWTVYTIMVLAASYCLWAFVEKPSRRWIVGRFGGSRRTRDVPTEIAAVPSGIGERAASS